MRLEPIVGTTQMMPSLRHYTMRKFNIWETNGEEGSSHTNYQQQGGNQDWNKDRDSGCKDWRGGNWRDREVDKERYVFPHDRQRPKDQTGPEGNKTEEMLTRIFNKVKGSDKVLKKLKNDFSTLSQMVTSHSVSIKQLKI
ncbi:hypothetical protein MTR67_047915 [Solanum verrucosum]|uniref:Uncharacterized protein n=1 Tax=Solanum verrucosum TaxID=315347 RepID=A0AAF0ZZ23_SOLVR|nr:hypothetical protein MTR67_047915 [Solanum verrucosum]